MADAHPAPPIEVTLLVPFGREDVVARLYREAEVLDSESRRRWHADPGAGGGA